MFAGPSFEKNTNESAKFEAIKALPIPFAWTRENISIKMHNIERFVVGPSNILFLGVYVCTFQPSNCKGWRSGGVKVISLLWMGSLD